MCPPLQFEWLTPNSRTKRICRPSGDHDASPSPLGDRDSRFLCVPSVRITYSPCCRPLSTRYKSRLPSGDGVTQTWPDTERSRRRRLPLTLTTSTNSVPSFMSSLGTLEKTISRPCRSQPQQYSLRSSRVRFQTRPVATSTG